MKNGKAAAARCIACLQDRMQQFNVSGGPYGYKGLLLCILVRQANRESASGRRRLSAGGEATATQGARRSALDSTLVDGYVALEGACYGCSVRRRVRGAGGGASGTEMRNGAHYLRQMHHKGHVFSREFQ